jgi:hypothetical protein
MLRPADQTVKLAIRSAPDDGLPWITLATAYAARRDYESAQVAATRAVERGAGYGNELLAQLRLARATRVSEETVEEYSRLKEQVTYADRRAYTGVAVPPNESLRRVWETQKQRSTAAYTSIKKGLA